MKSEHKCIEGSNAKNLASWRKALRVEHSVLGIQRNNTGNGSEEEWLIIYNYIYRQYNMLLGEPWNFRQHPYFETQILNFSRFHVWLLPVSYFLDSGLCNFNKQFQTSFQTTLIYIQYNYRVQVTSSKKSKRIILKFTSPHHKLK